MKKIPNPPPTFLKPLPPPPPPSKNNNKTILESFNRALDEINAANIDEFGGCSDLRVASVVDKWKAFLKSQ